MFKSFLQFVFCIILCSITVLGHPAHMEAQDKSDPFYITDVRPDTVSPFWSNDSRFFVFAGLPWVGAVQADYAAWFQYEVATEEVISTNRWPLQPELTSEQLDAFEVGSLQNESYGNQPSRIFLSPNGRYIVYGTHLPNDWPPSNYQTTLGIADLQSGDHIVIEIPIPAFGSVSCVSGYFCILWADDSSAFMLSASIPIGVTQQYYFAGFTSNLADIKATEISEYAFVLREDATVELATTEDGGAETYTLGFWDIFDNDHILLNLSQKLVLWNPSDVSKSKVLDIGDTEVFNASFYPNTSSKVLYVTEEGLVEYDVEEEQSIVLDSNIKSRYTFFSPNGRFLVNTVYDDKENVWAFFMIDLFEYGVQ